MLGRFPELVPYGPDSFIGHSAREPGIIHRLDTETSGAVVVARTAAAFETLKAALKGGRLDKRYLLRLRGAGPARRGVDRVSARPTTRRTSAASTRASTRATSCATSRARRGPATGCSQRAGTWALVEASVGKALRHQIRAHFAAIGHPLAGDELYGGPVIRALGRHALHAARVAYPGGEGVDAFDASVPLPKDMAALLEAGAAGEDVDRPTPRSLPRRARAPSDALARGRRGPETRQIAGSTESCGARNGMPALSAS